MNSIVFIFTIVLTFTAVIFLQVSYCDSASLLVLDPTPDEYFSLNLHDSNDTSVNDTDILNVSDDEVTNSSLAGGETLANAQTHTPDVKLKNVTVTTKAVKQETAPIPPNKVDSDQKPDAEVSAEKKSKDPDPDQKKDKFDVDPDEVPLPPENGNLDKHDTVPPNAPAPTVAKDTTVTTVTTVKPAVNTVKNPADRPPVAKQNADNIGNEDIPANDNQDLDDGTFIGGKDYNANQNIGNKDSPDVQLTPNDSEKPKQPDAQNMKVTEKQKGSPELPPVVFPQQENNHFFPYFLGVVAVCVIGYFLLHNKQKIMALIIEGRHGRRRRSHSYRKLENEGSKGTHPIF